MDMSTLCASLALAKNLDNNVKDELSEQMVVVKSEKVDLGALSSGTYGIKDTKITIPSGYKTTGLCIAMKQHIANTGGALVLSATVADDTETEATVWVSYYAPINIANGFSDYYIYVLCVRKN